ncbi:MAG: pilus assembly protein PilM, partial [Candidatus Omnitrophica bacterium]|nr:pilus assembly protein PilM [Candidatus Omnitrophota bacterium]
MKIKFPILSILVKKSEPIKGMFIQPRMRTSLEITEEYIKLAQFEYIKEMPRLIHLVTRKIPSPNEEDAVKTLRVALSGLKIKGPVLSCLSRHQVTVRYLKLPSANTGELEAMLDFQVAKQIPYPREETLYSYLAINIDPSGYTDVLLAIVHQEVVCRHLRILKACNLEPELVSFNALASSAWFLHINRQPEEAVLFVDVDAIYTDIGIIDSQGLSFTRTVKLGGNDFESEHAAAALKQLNEEARLSVSSYEKDSGASAVKRIILTGAVSILDKIKGAFEKELRFEVEIKLPLEGIEVSKNVLEKNWFDMHKVSLSAVLGLGLEKEALCGLNLLPPSVKAGRDKVKTKHEI